MNKEEISMDSRKCWFTVFHSSGLGVVQTSGVQTSVVFTLATVAWTTQRPWLRAERHLTCCWRRGGAKFAGHLA